MANESPPQFTMPPTGMTEKLQTIILPASSVPAVPSTSMIRMKDLVALGWAKPASSLVVSAPTGNGAGPIDDDLRQRPLLLPTTTFCLRQRTNTAVHDDIGSVRVAIPAGPNLTIQSNTSAALVANVPVSTERLVPEQMNQGHVGLQQQRQRRQPGQLGLHECKGPNVSFLKSF